MVTNQDFGVISPWSELIDVLLVVILLMYHLNMFIIKIFHALKKKDSCLCQ